MYTVVGFKIKRDLIYRRAHVYTENGFRYSYRLSPWDDLHNDLIAKVEGAYFLSIHINVWRRWRGKPKIVWVLADYNRRGVGAGRFRNQVPLNGFCWDGACRSGDEDRSDAY